MIRLTTGFLEFVLNVISRLLSLTRNNRLLDLIMYSFLFVCIFTSHDWRHINPAGELFRFDKFHFMRQVDIFYLFGGIFFVILFIRKFVIRVEQNVWGERNYLKNIFWLFFVPVNLLVYFTISYNNITVEDLGVIHVVRAFVYLCTVYYIQDVFLNNKNEKQLRNVLTVVEVIIFLRVCASVGKYLLGYGHEIKLSGIGLAASGVQETMTRLGQENDFADFFILLFIISLTGLLFNKNENKYIRLLHYAAQILSSYIIIMSLRRYAWVQFFVAGAVVLFFYYSFRKDILHKKIILFSLIGFLTLSTVLYIGPDKLQDNYFIGRFLTVLSLIEPEYETAFGHQTGHLDEILDGWLNVKKHWILGVSPFGGELMERPRTHEAQGGLVFVHNAFLFMWLQFGLLGVVLFLCLYIMSIRLGYRMFMRFRNNMGLILMTFLICQMLKNIVWHTVILLVNETIVYIFLISLVLRAEKLLMIENKKNNKQAVLTPGTELSPG